MAGETGQTGASIGVWAIDPIDGTTNYLSGSDQWCVSVAWFLNGICMIGVIFAPDRDELFQAENGAGADCLANVAQGRAVGYFEAYLNIWDFAAGELICQEAGYTVATSETPTDPFAGRAVCVAHSSHSKKIREATVSPE